MFVKHAFDEHSVNVGEVLMNYAVAGSEGIPALLLISGQTEEPRRSARRRRGRDHGLRLQRLDAVPLVRARRRFGNGGQMAAEEREAS